MTSIDSSTKIRISLLATLFGATLLVLAKSFLYSGAKARTFTPFEFPPSVSLESWQSVESKPLPNNTKKEKPKYIAGIHYRYTLNNRPLDIEMRYLAENDGEVDLFLKTYTAIPTASDRFKPLLRQQEKLGFYNLFTHEGRAYLSACINPRGGSTVNLEQFRSNRDTYDMTADRWLPWLLGQAELRDKRCLWALLSTPLKKKESPEQAYKILEQAWLPWYQSWMPNFPKP
jgi:cyanosortase A-associated protein